MLARTRDRVRCRLRRQAGNHRKYEGLSITLEGMTAPDCQYAASANIHAAQGSVPFPQRFEFHTR